LSGYEVLDSSPLVSMGRRETYGTERKSGQDLAQVGVSQARNIVGG